MAKTIEELKRMVKELVGVALDKSKEVRPFVLGFRPDGELAILDVAEMMGDKDALSLLISKLREVLSPMAFVSESWVVELEASRASEASKITPSEHPDRREVVSVCLYHGMRSEILMADMQRADGRVWVENWKDISGIPGGRMSNAPASWN